MLSAIPETAEPFPFFLEDTLAREAVGTHNGVQAGLGGDGLPPTIVKGDALIRDLSDQVTMEADLCDLAVHGDAGVLQGPVTTIGDGGVHEAFDLAHDAVRLVWKNSTGSPDVVRTDRVTVYPLSQAGVAREPEQFQDLHAVDVSVAVLSQRTFEPTDTGSASDRVQAEGPDAGAVVAVDGEAHQVVCCWKYCIRSGAGHQVADQ